MTDSRYLRAHRGGSAAVALAAMVALASCGGAESSQESAETITLWQYYGDPSSPTGGPLYDFIDRYEQENDGVEVEVRFIPAADFDRTLLQAAAGGDLPDIALINAFDTAAMAEAGVLQDLSDRVTEWGEADAYLDTGWATTQVDGKTYGIPHVADAYAIYYNTAMFAEAGLQPPQTWDDMETVAAQLSDGSRAGLAVSGIEGVEGSTGLVIRMLAAGGEVDQPDSDAGREALEQFTTLTASGALSEGFLTWTEDDVKNQFAQSQAAMMINSATYVSILREESPDLQWDVALLPADEERLTYLSAENLTITTGSDDPDQAWDLIEFMQQPDQLAEYLPARNKLPARDDVPDTTDDPARAVFADQLAKAWAPQDTLATKSGEVFTFLQQALQAAVSGAATVDAAASQAQSDVDEALAQ
ncbi:ABC transporter substrate-binding protein [Jiangella asiatica]|uniref:Sugar ABC transporter substrate-binding protein n=1 Tax=Jiangella asiatica TaxID=2530372 RepID=A0A4R5CL04_9ACTN|nr:sugar ABC transporter substrate-binding protein [Jiangella asiatica]TDE01019.1 sugar ABC transporter substrate-binding protein [Jiangella asiatica]